MREPPNKFLRVLVPLLLLLGGIGIALAVLTNTTKPSPVATTPPAAPAAPPSAGAPAPTANAPAASETPAAPEPEIAAAPAPQPPAGQPAGPAFYARQYDPPANGFTPIGAIVPAAEGGQFQMRVHFALLGAGIETLQLANHYETIWRTEHETIQRLQRWPGDTDSPLGAVPFAAERIEIDGVGVNLGVGLIETAPNTLEWDGLVFWRETEPGVFEATILNRDGAEVLRITRRYTLPPDSYEFEIEQRFDNLTDRPLSLTWYQFGPVDLPLETVRYGGDVRRARFGYLLDPTSDPDRIVQSDDDNPGWFSHQQLVGELVPDGQGGKTPVPERTVWPNDLVTARNLELVWAAMTNRYFTVAVYPSLDPAAVAQPGASKAFSSIARVDRLAIPFQKDPSFVGTAPTGTTVLRLVSQPVTVRPAASVELAMNAYAGPLSTEFIRRQPVAAAAGLDEIVIYTMGGPCAFCTFQPITHLLRWFLGVLEAYILRDWALAIMLLVVCVRTVLHPVTRWSQINLMRFGKQMQRLAPKQKALQEKYGADPVKMRQEMARLMREEKVNYAGALGCLPMFLQTPIWIALYAMLSFTFELRHEAAFFGLFQAISGGGWAFLGDLAEPDHLVPFGRSISIPLLSYVMGPIDGINLLPLLLGVVFFIQQKYLTPPPSAPLSPEQEQQQKMMKVMMVVLFPLFMYNAPSGLALYFITNSTLGIFESRYIRRHVDKLELEPPKPRKGGDPSKPSLLERIQAQVEERQKSLDEARKLQQRRGKKR